ncbi:MAG: TlpA disulfide reductase family protein [Thermodesulfobacteriota bacterium]|jgi:cytochrome c biogenesis protein CcmG/thiol:disulfide interchange protein DsbE|nr:MAG: TlpA disulfide reductase family protein [Thermodesulfobacteriota bacterium]
MEKNKQVSIFLMIVFFFFLVGGFVCESKSENLKTAPELNLTDLNGNTFKLSDHRGKVIILNFWALWCPPCQIEIPYLVALYDKYKDNGLIILGIAIGSGNDKKIKEKAKEWGIDYPVINGDEFSSIQKNFREVRAIPNSYLINQEGKFFKNYVGFSTTTSIELEKDIKTLLKQ